jgi:hemerythrin superfamily protein
MGFFKEQWKKITGQDALDVLRDHHKEIDALFKQFDSSEDEKTKQECVARACRELVIHAQIEEDLFYPAVRAELPDQDIMDEAEVEHLTFKRLIAELGTMKTSDRLHHARFKVLGEYVRHHVREEENEMFPKVKGTKIDLQALGDEMADMRQELTKNLKPRTAGKSRSKSSKSTRGAQHTTR